MNATNFKDRDRATVSAATDDNKVGPAGSVSKEDGDRLVQEVSGQEQGTTTCAHGRRVIKFPPADKKLDRCASNPDLPGPVDSKTQFESESEKEACSIELLGDMLYDARLKLEAAIAVQGSKDNLLNLSETDASDSESQSVAPFVYPDSSTQKVLSPSEMRRILGGGKPVTKNNSMKETTGLNGKKESDKNPIDKCVQKQTTQN